MDNKTIDSVIRTLKKYSQMSKLSRVCINTTSAMQNCHLPLCLTKPWLFVDGASCCRSMAVADELCSGENVLSLWISQPSPTPTLANSKCGNLLCLDSAYFQLFAIVVLALCVVLGLFCCLLLVKMSGKLLTEDQNQIFPLLLLLFNGVVGYGIIVPGHIGLIYGCMEMCDAVFNCYTPLIISSASRLTESAMLLLFPLFQIITPAVQHWKCITSSIFASIIISCWILGIIFTTQTLDSTTICNVSTKWLLDMQITSKFEYFTIVSQLIFTISAIIYFVLRRLFASANKLAFGNGSRFLPGDVRWRRRHKQRLFLQKLTSGNCIIYKIWTRSEFNATTVGPLVVIFASTINNWLCSLLANNYSANLYALFVTWRVLWHTLLVLLLAMYFQCKK